MFQITQDISRNSVASNFELLTKEEVLDRCEPQWRSLLEDILESPSFLRVTLKKTGGEGEQLTFTIKRIC